MFLNKFSVLKVLGLKKASKFDLYQKCQKSKSSFLNIQKNSFRNELHAITYFDTQHSIYEIFPFLLFGCRGVPGGPKDLKIFFMISKNYFK